MPKTTTLMKALTEDEVRAIRQPSLTREEREALADKLNIKHSSFAMVRRGKFCSWLNETIPPCTVDGRGQATTRAIARRKANSPPVEHHTTGGVAVNDKLYAINDGSVVQMTETKRALELRLRNREQLTEQEWQQLYRVRCKTSPSYRVRMSRRAHGEGFTMNTGEDPDDILT